MAAKTIRLTDEHIIDIVQLSKSVGWDFDERDAKTLLRSGHAFGIEKESSELVSCATAVLYDDQLASLGMVIVHPDHQGKKLGKIVTKTCIEELAPNMGMICVATNEGYPLYEKLGFRPLANIHKFTANNLTHKPGEPLEEYAPKHLEQIIEVDRKAFGSRRSLLMRNRIEQAERVLVVKNDREEIAGFGMAIQGQNMRVVGPIVAPDLDRAKQLILQLAHTEKSPVRIDLPDVRLGSFLEELGFQEVATPWMMGLNIDALPKRNDHLYAIVAQAYG